jgi:hypothetical protein
MATEDKARIMIHETLQVFARNGISFQSGDEMLDAIATYLDHCIFITDSDLEAWGTCPTICVLGPRTPTRREIDELFGDIESIRNPIAIINPSGRNDPLLGLDTRDVFETFEPLGTDLGNMLADMAQGKNVQQIYSAQSNTAVRGRVLGQ